MAEKNFNYLTSYIISAMGLANEYRSSGQDTAHLDGMLTGMVTAAGALGVDVDARVGEDGLYESVSVNGGKPEFCKRRG